MKKSVIDEIFSADSEAKDQPGKNGKNTDHELFRKLAIDSLAQEGMRRRQPECR